jgi:hypothetical protein
MGNYSIKAIFDKEPVVIAGAIRAVIYVLVLFGLKVTVEQLAGIALGLELVLGLVARQSVTPAAK